MRLIALVAAAIVLPACGASETLESEQMTPAVTYVEVAKCGPQNCLGCCREDFCHVPSAADCGAGGKACVTCEGEAICGRSGYCINPSGDPYGHIPHGPAKEEVDEQHIRQDEQDKDCPMLPSGGKAC